MEKPDNCSTEVYALICQHASHEYALLGGPINFIYTITSCRYDIMLKCWNEQPQKRPSFTELRSKFDVMLVANKKNEYIDLRIDQNKLYYQQFSPGKKKKKSLL